MLGIEPDARMAEVARRSGVEVEVVTFEAWDPAGRAFDAVIAATAWHWVDPLAGAAKAALVLRPGGRLTVFGHAFQLPHAVADAFAAVYRQVVPDSPVDLQPLRQGALEAYQRMYAKFADAIGEAGGFEDPQQWRLDWEQTYTRDEWLDQMPTHGSLTQLSADKLTDVLDGTGAAIDAMGGNFTIPYATVGVSAARILG